MESIGVDGLFSQKVCDLSMRVYARIGASRAVGCNYMIQNVSDRSLQLALKRPDTRLELPSMKECAVISKG